MLELGDAGFEFGVLLLEELLDGEGVFLFIMHFLYGEYFIINGRLWGIEQWRFNNKIRYFQ